MVDDPGQEPLTERERAMLADIVLFCAEHGFSPTVRELAERLEMSRGTAHRTLVALKRKKRVSWSGSRTVRKLPDPKPAPA